MRVAIGDLIASLFLAVFATGFFGLVYNINPQSGWPILTTIGLLSFLVMAYILQNQRKNQRKWEKRPITFPNPEGGGILGVYVERPWYSELAELGRRYKRKTRNCKKREVGTGCGLHTRASFGLGVEGYVEGVGSADVKDALDCSCSSNPC